MGSNPDPCIEHHYSARVPLRRLPTGRCCSGISACRTPAVRFFASVNRLTWQKGMDMPRCDAGEIVKNGGTLIIHGQGEEKLEAAFIGSHATVPAKHKRKHRL